MEELVGVVAVLDLMDKLQTQNAILNVQVTKEQLKQLSLVEEQIETKSLQLIQITH